LEDPDLWSAAQDGGHLLISTDRGFTEFRMRPHHGIVIDRLRQPNRLKINQAVMLAIERFQDTKWAGLLVVVRDSTLSLSRFGGAVEWL
jgi:hypothetical protein